MKLKNLVIGPMKISTKEWNFIKKTDWDQLAIIDGGDTHLDELKAYISQRVFKKKAHFGDGDSSKHNPENFKHNQNLSDLAFYLDSQKGILTKSDNYFFGLLGGNLDHMLFNFGAWINSLDEAVKVKNQTQLYHIGPDVIIIGRGDFRIQIHSRFSLLAIYPCLVKLKGDCEFPLEKWVKLKPFNSLTLSNRGYGEINLTSKGSLILFSKDLLSQ